MAQNGESFAGSSEAARKKVISSNLLNMKFMQRGRDAEVAAKLQEQCVREVSDQQWHLNVVLSTDTVKPEFSGKRVIYEPSYNAFEPNESHISAKREMDRGRKIFGSFTPDLDVSATLIQALMTLQELLQPVNGKQEDRSLPVPSDENGREDESGTNVQKRPKRTRGESSQAGGDRRGKRLRKIPIQELS